MSADRLIAIYYRAPDGTMPVRDAVRALTPARRAHVNRGIALVNALCTEARPHLPFPHGSQIEGEFRELRCHSGATLYRIIYRRSQRFAVLLHVFEKTTGKVPPGAIALAKRRWDDFRRRIESDPRTPPRPLGLDAPETASDEGERAHVAPR